MSVSSTTTRIAVTVTALPQTVATFEFNSSADLLVLDGGLNNTANDPATVLTLGSDYTVTGGGYNSSNQLQTGNVVLASGGTGNIQVGDVITILRNITPLQDTTFASTGLQTPLMIEQDDDTLTTLVQELLDKVNLCLKFELNETELTTLQRSARAGNVLGFDSNGNISFVSGQQFLGGIIISSVTAFTGATGVENPPVHIDGINTALYPTLPYLFGFIINGALSWWYLQTSSTSTGRGVIQPVSNSALRFIQVA